MDRYVHVTTDSLDQAVRQFESKGFSAVSYTHLDVYKRQSVGFFRNGREKRIVQHRHALRLVVEVIACAVVLAEIIGIAAAGRGLSLIHI